MSLYRKYRPLDFSSLEGQNHIRDILLGALKSGKVSHAYLFTGPRGTGKTSTARIMSRAINCLNLSANGPCNSCEICSSALEERLTDVVEIDAASHGLVDDARALVEQARFMPTQAKKKIYIIDEVHMLSKSAFNALLKIIEEPPEHVHFILATTEAHKVLDTIKSRCQRFDFHLADEQLIAAQLRKVCDAEQVKADEAALKILSVHARGSFRDALSLLEQVVGMGEVTETSVQMSLGISQHSSVESFLSSLLDGKSQEALQIVHEIHEQGHDLSQFCQLILEQLRSRLLQGDPQSQTLLSWVDIFFVALDQLRDAFIPQMPLELAVFKCLKFVSPSSASLPAPLEMINPAPAPVTSTSKPRKVISKAPVTESVQAVEDAPPSPVPVTGFDLEKFFSLISSVPLRSLLKHSKILLSEKGLKIQARYDFELGKIREPSNLALLSQAYEQMTGSRASIEFEVQPASDLPSQAGLSNNEVKSVFL
ncbi:MAG: DNA polymerase III subunit gamma/tau [Candidatus Altimarinota bacterium]